jgi:DNA-binding winged helix-turn-helix (wHTH) protein/tetratricopeptide (TPR) repeat protein
MSAESYRLFSPYQLDPRNERLLRGAELIPLRPKPFALLRYMVEHPGRLVTHEELRKAIWPTTFVGEGVLRLYLREVRAALGDDAESPKFIETIARRGYRFIAEVKRRGDADDLEEAAQAAVATSSKAMAPVGRETELARLRSAFLKASTGMRQVVFLSGEAGIGKSTVLEAFLAHVATRDGVLIGRGQCVEHRGESEPYLPVIDALSRLSHHDRGGRVAETIRNHAPSWLAQMPALLDDADAPGNTSAAQGATQQRMLREIAEALERLTANRIVILALEDLHWSDPSTLTLLDLLARRPERARLMILGTHRPIATLSAEHPLRTTVGELAGRYCDDLKLAPLSSSEVAEYLQQRITEASPPDEAALKKVANAIHHRTEGNPLFMVALLDSMLRSNGSAVSDSGDAGVSLEKLAENSGHIAPGNVMEMIGQQLARLDTEDQVLLEVASVVGTEFSAAAIAGAIEKDLMEVERHCAALVNRMAFLQDAGDAEWPDGTVAARFRFQHALYWESVYGHVTAARRAHLHQKIGEHQETAYGERTAEVAAELARHFTQSRDYERAFRYRHQAAHNALRASASREAVEHLVAAMDALAHLPDGIKKLERELELRLAMGAALQASKGYGAPEVQQAYERASELCRRLGETPQLFPALMGLWSFAVGRGDWKLSHQLAERNLRLAESVQDPAQLARSWRSLGHGRFFLGELSEARDNLEKAIALCGQHQPQLDHFVYTSNIEVDARSALAWTLELMGFSEQALVMSRRALGAAEQFATAHDLVYATYFTAVLYGFRQEWDTTIDWSKRTIELATEHGLPYYQLMGSHILGAALAQIGQPEKGLPMMQQAVQTSLAIGVEAGLTAMYLMIAEACRKAGEFRAGQDAITDAFRFVKLKEEHAWEAELLRTRAELLLEQHRNARSAKGSKSSEKDAEDTLLRSIELAHSQGAKKWALRSTTSLAKLYQHQKKKKEAQQRLSEAYTRFKEGFETQDLLAAKELLDELT